MKKKSTIIVVISMIILLTIIALASYSFFGLSNLNITNAVNLNTTTERNNMVFDTLGGSFNLHVDAGDMTEYLSGNIAAENNTTLTVNFQANTSYDTVCTYDIVYEWTSTNKYQAHTTGVTEKEFTIQAELTSNANVNEGMNLIKNEVDLADLVGNKTSAVVVSGAQIDSTGTNMNTAIWTLTTRFYNANGNQTTLAGKTYSGRFRVANVSCVGGSRTHSLADYLVNIAPKSGTDAVSNSPWILTSDHTDEWRYAGKNPDNYIEFNGELWRIIGVMPNMTYCTGLYSNTSAVESECDTTATGNLVKIIRNGSLGNFSWDYKQTGMGSSTSDNGSNDWSDSQLMMMLNNGYYVYNGYDVNNNRLHQSYNVGNDYVYLIQVVYIPFYDNRANYLDGNGTTVYIPSSAAINNYDSDYTSTSGTVPKKIESTALDQIATVKWDLYGISTNTVAADALYDSERNINGSGLVYSDVSLPENRPVYWYGKVGLPYPSDYGYAAIGDSSSGISRASCIQSNVLSWQTMRDFRPEALYCSDTDYLLFNNMTSANVSTRTNIWFLTPSGANQYQVSNTSRPRSNATETFAVRPTLYLKADTYITGGSGTWNDPYTITSDKVKKYWFAMDGSHTYPSYGGTLQTSGVATGHNVYIGQDNYKYHACLTYQDHEICLSQPYKQYGLSYGVSNTFTTGQMNSAKQALYQAFIDAGININISSDCGGSTTAVWCEPGDRIGCELASSGLIYCYDNYEEQIYCNVNTDGTAYCDE